MALDLLLLHGSASDLEAACRRGYWPPVPLPLQQARGLTHLAVLAPEAEAIAAVAEINHLLRWVEQDGQLWWLPLLGPLRRLRRPIAAGRSRELARWQPRAPGQMRLLSIDELLLCDSLADYLRRSRRPRRRGEVNPAPLVAWGPGTSPADPPPAPHHGRNTS